MTDLAIDIRGLYKRYPYFALEDVTLSLPTGSVMGFIGANGAGKSTTMRMLMGMATADRGNVRVLGHEIPTQAARAKQDIGYICEDMRLYDSATIAWHMQFIARSYTAWDNAYADKLLQRFDLKAEQKIRGLSHGQRVKALLLLALARKPRLLVLDEPTTGLDPVARHEVIASLMEVLADEQRSILFSSHNTADVEQIADRITFIDRGRIIDADDKENYLDRWRRLRLDLPADKVLPKLPGIVAVHSSGRLHSVTLNQFDPALLAAFQHAGASVLAVENLTLEEIFVTNVISRREVAAA